MNVALHPLRGLALCAGAGGLEMIFATACSGIGAPECAWGPLGWECAWQAETEPFPSAVLALHCPGVPNRGDMTRFQEWPDEPSIELLCGGTPCQSFSVAGLRKGLDDPRGNLALVFLGIVDRYRPRWVVWENVPGVLSVDEGRAFGSFIGGLAKLGYGLFWRILDAQYFGVPQRRRRVFVVGYLGDWRPPCAVLLEPESLRGDSPPRRQAGKEVAGRLGGGAQARGWNNDLDRSGAFVTANSTSGAGYWREGFGALRGRSQDSHENLIAHSLLAEGFDASEDGTGRGTPLVAFSLRGREGGAMPEVERGDVAPSMRVSSGGGGQHTFIASMSVRRLTPRECERLQGFPDDYTAITLNGKRAADGPRYRALGNSMAVPVMRWIGERIQMFEEVAGGAPRRPSGNCGHP